MTTRGHDGSSKTSPSYGVQSSRWHPLQVSWEMADATAEFDPRAATAAGFDPRDSLDILYLTAGVNEAQAPVLLQSIGEPESFQDLADLHPEDLNGFLQVIRIPGPALPEGEAPPDGAPELIPCTPVQRARIRGITRQAQLALRQMPPSGAPLERGVVTHPPAGREPPGPPAATHIKLSSLVDVTADAELQPLDGNPLNKHCSGYLQTYGVLLSPEIEPTAEQLSAVHPLLQADASPYVDFSMCWTTWAAVTHTSHLFSSTRILPAMERGNRAELPGSPSYGAWMQAWRVYECTLQLLKGVTLEGTRSYSDLSLQLHEQFGPPVRPIIYQADVRGRATEFERHRRAVELQSPPGSPALKSVWHTVLSKAVSGLRFWQSPVREPAILYSTRVKGMHALLSDGFALDIIQVRRAATTLQQPDASTCSAPPSAQTLRQVTLSADTELSFKYNQEQCSAVCPI